MTSAAPVSGFVGTPVIQRIATAEGSSHEMYHVLLAYIHNAHADPRTQKAAGGSSVWLDDGLELIDDPALLAG